MSGRWIGPRGIWYGIGTVEEQRVGHGKLPGYEFRLSFNSHLEMAGFGAEGVVDRYR